MENHKIESALPEHVETIKKLKETSVDFEYWCFMYNGCSSPQNQHFAFSADLKNMFLEKITAEIEKYNAGEVSE